MTTANATEDEQRAAQEVFAGGGEMGERMRAIDWRKSALGPVQSWPQSLRTCVRIVLTSRQPMFVWWGDELINLYNDAYKSIVGGKHPAALGQPARTVWSEIWHEIGPRAEATMRRNEGTYDEALMLIMERHGYREETYYTFSYSPVPNDQGGIGGILCANTDDTQKIIGERQLNLLRELASGAGSAHSRQQACARAADSLTTDLRDLPFALLYLSDASGESLELIAASGIDAGHPAVPAKLDPRADTPWPICSAYASDEPVLIDFVKQPGLPTGAWHVPPSQGVAIGLLDPGAGGRGGLLIAGLNPFRQIDERYRGFLRLVAGQIAAAVASANAYERERKRAEALAELDRAKTAFFSNVSHEFRTPLTLMLGPTEDALAAGALRGENLRTVYRNQLRLLKLVNNLLDFSRIEAGRTQASFAPTDLGALTRDLASSFRAAVERAGLQLVVDCPALPAEVHVDVEMWEKIVLNLLSNAFKFTFEGSIQVSIRSDAGACVLTVSDTGTGIPESELPHVFRRFHRVQGARSRTHEGSGIGLALVHELVQMHGGTITVKSELGRGTAFTIELPLGTAHLPVERLRAARTLATTSTSAAAYVEEAMRWLPESLPPVGSSDTDERPSVRAERVLIADDNADMRGYLRRIVGEHWHVEVVSDGAAALACMREAPPDLVLTDVMMPELDGFGLLHAVKNDPVLREVPVLMISARAGEEARIEGLVAGADDYLVKPFSARELVARIETHLKLARLRSRAERERVRFYSFLSQAPVPIAVYEGSELKVAYLNDRALQLIGDRNIVGQPLMAAMPSLAGSPLAAQVTRVYQTGVPEAAFEQPIVLDLGGQTRTLYMTTFHQALRDESGAIYGVISGAHDVTEAVHARQALEAKSVEAASASRAKDEFLAMLGHELRNPLAPISTALHLMRLRGANVFERERAIVERQVEHLVRLVDDLLEVSRITRGKVTLHRTTLDLGDVIAQALEMASPLIEQRKHHLDVRVEPGLRLDGDAARLAQVFSNLLTNAAKYTPTSGHISVRGSREGDQLVVSVRDDGDGIRAEILPNVFELFVQESQSIARAAGGLGLGLSIVRSLVALHGGSVEAHSAGVGQGCEFLVRLPAELGDPMPIKLRSRPPIATAHHNSHKRILVVDDNEDAAETLAEVLQELGHDVQIAHDGAAALDRLRSFTPDVAFLDIGLPVMDGYELARRIRSECGDTQIRLIAVTGYGQAKDRIRTKEAGFDDHLVKPVDPGTIHQFIEAQNGRPT